MFRLRRGLRCTTRCLAAVILLLTGVRFVLAQRATVRYSKDQSHERRDRSRFPHNKPKHKTLDCARCHEVTIILPVARKNPDHDACIACHNFAEMTVRGFSGFCGVCHTGLPATKEDAKLFPFPKAERRGDFGIDFSHPRHAKPFAPPPRPGPELIAPAGLFEEALAMRTVSCSGCHLRRQKTSVDQVPELSLPSGHRYCFVCHGPTPVRQPSLNQCTGCHKLGDLPAARVYGKVTDFEHLDHEIDIRRRRKGEPVARGDDLCVTCHRSAANAERLADIKLPPLTSCGQCHNGGLGFPENLSAAVETILKQ